MPTETLTRRSFMTAAAALSASFAAPTGLIAQAAYPTRPVHLIVPYAAGGGTDFFARLVAASMSGTLGQQIVVENRPGAGTQIGAEAASKAEPTATPSCLATPRPTPPTKASTRSCHMIRRRISRRSR